MKDMKVLGIRCSNKDYTFAILSGTKQSPKLIDSGTIAYPRGFLKPHSLKWLLEEIEELLKRYNIEIIAIKGFEGRTRDKGYEERVEYEAMVYLTATNLGIKAVFKKVKSTSAKNLGLKGRACYLSKSLDTSLIPDLRDLNPSK